MPSYVGIYSYICIQYPLFWRTLFHIWWEGIKIQEKHSFCPQLQILEESLNKSQNKWKLQWNLKTIPVSTREYWIQYIKPTFCVKPLWEHLCTKWKYLMESLFQHITIFQILLPICPPHILLPDIISNGPLIEWSWFYH